MFKPILEERSSRRLCRLPTGGGAGCQFPFFSPRIVTGSDREQPGSVKQISPFARPQEVAVRPQGSRNPASSWEGTGSGSTRPRTRAPTFPRDKSHKEADQRLGGAASKAVDAAHRSLRGSLPATDTTDLGTTRAQQSRPPTQQTYRSTRLHRPRVTMKNSRSDGQNPSPRKNQGRTHTLTPATTFAPPLPPTARAVGRRGQQQASTRSASPRRLRRPFSRASDRRAAHEALPVTATPAALQRPARRGVGILGFDRRAPSCQASFQAINDEYHQRSSAGGSARRGRRDGPPFGTRVELLKRHQLLERIGEGV